MNIGVGKVSDAARKAILEAGGSVEPAANPGLLLVQLPSSVLESSAAKDDSFATIYLPSATLRFTRAWETKDCRIDTEEEALSYYEKGKVVGRKWGKEFTGLDEALLAVVACDLIDGQGKRQQYVDGFCAGFYEVHPESSEK